jgi:Ca2+-transporting ATPase
MTKEFFSALKPLRPAFKWLPMTTYIPQIAVVGIQDNNSPGPTLDAPPTSHDNSFPLSPTGHASSPSDFHGFLSPSTNSEKFSKFSDLPGSPASHTSDASSLQPPPSPSLSAHSSGSIRWANSTVLHDNNAEEHDGLSSLGLLAPPSQEDSPGLRLSPVCSGHSDAPSTHSSPTNTHMDPGSDTSRPSSLASFLKRTVWCVRPIS